MLAPRSSHPTRSNHDRWMHVHVHVHVHVLPSRSLVTRKEALLPAEVTVQRAWRNACHLPTFLTLLLTSLLGLLSLAYQVNEALMAATGKDETIFLHCLPAERGKETTDGVMESAQSHVFRQASRPPPTRVWVGALGPLISA